LPFALLRIDADSEPLADRAFLSAVSERPEAPGHRLVDHDEIRAARHVLFGDETAIEQRNTQCPKIIVAGAAEIYFGPMSPLTGLAFDLREGSHVAERAQRQSRDGAGRSDLRQRFQSRFKLAIELGSLLGSGVFRRRQQRLRRQYIFRDEAGID